MLQPKITLVVTGLEIFLEEAIRKACQIVETLIREQFSLEENMPSFTSDKVMASEIEWV